LLATSDQSVGSGSGEIERRCDTVVLILGCNLENPSILAFVVPLTPVAARPRGYCGDGEVDGRSLAAKSLLAI